MGTHILNLGNNRTEKYTPDINMINSKSNSSTGNQVANTFINTVFGFGAIALSGAMAKKGTSNTQTKQTQEAEQKNPTLTEYQKVTIQLTQCDGTLKGLREQLETANNEVIRLTKATDENEIKAKEAEVNKLKEELYKKMEHTKKMFQKLLHVMKKLQQQHQHWKLQLTITIQYQVKLHL